MVTPKSRPAETGSAAGSVGLLIAYALGLDDPAVIVAIGAVLGCVPAAITWLVELLRGRSATAEK